MKFHSGYAVAACLLCLLAVHGCTRSADRSKTPRLKIPAGYVVRPPVVILRDAGDVALRLSARSFMQGEVVSVEIMPSGGKRTVRPGCRFEFSDVYLSRRKWGYRGFLGISPDEAPGPKAITVSFRRGKSIEEYYFHFVVKAAAFPVYKRPLNLGRFSNVTHPASPETMAFITDCAEKKDKAFSRVSSDMVSPFLSHPRDSHHITSPFWAGRRYSRFRFSNGARKYLAPENNVHRGIDLQGRAGDPVFALADGIVALAGRMFYEGNFVVIDHGNRIFSYYMHHETLNVKTGRRVRAGDLIGTVGSTGISTGPHLHVSLQVNGIQVDPLSILSLEIRN